MLAPLGIVVTLLGGTLRVSSRLRMPSVAATMWRGGRIARLFQAGSEGDSVGTAEFAQLYRRLGPQIAHLKYQRRAPAIAQRQPGPADKEGRRRGVYDVIAPVNQPLAGMAAIVM